MNLCPRDRQILASNDVSGYRYYSCELCSGYWIPGATLHRVFTAQGIRELRVGTRAEKGEIRCPDCHTDCVSLVIEGCRLDRCPKCHGVWLDAGEVQRLKRLFPEASPVVLADESRPSKESQQDLVAWSLADAVVNLLLLVLR